MTGYGNAAVREQMTRKRGVAVEGGAGHDVCSYILDLVGLRPRKGDEQRLLHWLDSRLAPLRLSSPESYAAFLQAESAAAREEREQLTGQFSTGETYFYRDPDLFRLLATRIVPQLIEKRSAQRALRIWSAGCASGEEAYSLAMLVNQLDLQDWDVRILGTDISGQAVMRARKGVYGAWSFRGLPSELGDRYFRHGARGREVVPRLREMVTFECRDLLRDDPTPTGGQAQAFDLVLCRNVFIYMSDAAVKQAVLSLTAALDGDGFLVPGHGELIGCDLPLQTRVYPEAVLYQKTGADHGSTASLTRVVPIPRLPAPRSAFPGGRESLPRPVRRLPPKPTEKSKAGTTEAGPGLRELLAAAWRAADRGEIGRARELCGQATSIAPLDAHAYYLLAQLAQADRSPDEAASLLRKVLYLDPRCIAALLDLAELALRSGDVRSARRHRMQAVRELECLPPDSILAHPLRLTAGTLLETLKTAIGRSAEESVDG